MDVAWAALLDRVAPESVDAVAEWLTSPLDAVDGQGSADRVAAWRAEQGW